MARINTVDRLPTEVTHEGMKAKRISPEQQLRRSVLSCFLWEKEFYEDGETIYNRIMDTASKCSKQFVSDLAIEARNVAGLRHVPLVLMLDLFRRNINEPGPKPKDVLFQVIQRPDEMTELLALYWRDKRIPMSKQFQRGLAKVFTKFDEYQLAKYNRDTPIKLRDVLFLSHAKPKDEAQARLFNRVANNKLETPDTWEVELSAGKDKGETFTRLLKEGKLGYLALLRNLRNMVAAGLDRDLISNAILERKGAKWVLPFRYIAAARACPSLEPVIEQALLSSLKDQKPFDGTTVVLVDVSGSMGASLSSKSDLTRVDAACALAVLINGEKRVFSFSSKTVEVPARPGFGGIDAIIKSQSHSSTEMARAINYINKNIKHDRIIVITDEQSSGYYGRSIPDPVCKKAYMINVASYRNGVGYGSWTHIDGFSENVINYIREIENMD